ncbi:MAG: transposase [Opitutales bacterium]|nr:transposase [Opitutales bacterium]
MDSKPGHKALRRGRFSQQVSTYFITICTSGRMSLLTKLGVPELIFNQLQEQDEHMQLRASVVMPDHVHFVSMLSDSSLDSTMGAFKGASSSAINLLLKRTGGVWQRGFRS